MKNSKFNYHLSFFKINYVKLMLISKLHCHLLSRNFFQVRVNFVFFHTVKMFHLHLYSRWRRAKRYGLPWINAWYIASLLANHFLLSEWPLWCNSWRQCEWVNLHTGPHLEEFSPLSWSISEIIEVTKNTNPFYQKFFLTNKEL